MDVQYGNVFIKQIHKADQKVRHAFSERLHIFKQNPHYPLLKNHLLVGQYLGYRSINITGDWRALYTETVNIDGEVVIVFELLGTHSQLYK